MLVREPTTPTHACLLYDNRKQTNCRWVGGWVGAGSGVGVGVKGVHEAASTSVRERDRNPTKRGSWQRQETTTIVQYYNALVDRWAWAWADALGSDRKTEITHGEEGRVEVQHRPTDVSHPPLVDDQAQPRAYLTEDVRNRGGEIDVFPPCLVSTIAPIPEVQSSAWWSLSTPEGGRSGSSSRGAGGGGEEEVCFMACFDTRHADSNRNGGDRKG